MSEPITFYTNPQSRGRIVHWMLEEVGVSYRAVVLDLDKREHKTPEFLAINPMGKVPVIVDRTLVENGVVVTEAAAICTYLADAYPAAQLAPATTDPRRGTYLRWLFYAAGCVEPALVDRMLARPAGDRPSALGYGSYDDVVATLEKAITPGPFILGDRFSAADVYLGSSIGWGIMAKTLEPRPAFIRYQEGYIDRPAFKRFAAQAQEMVLVMKQSG